MKMLQLTALASILVAGMAQASKPCDGFEVQIKNKLLEDLLVTKIVVDGAEIQPGGIQKINSSTAETFTINKTANSNLLKGNMQFHTISLPTRKINIQFDLKNNGLICEHTDFSQATDFSLEKSRLTGQVRYTIANKK